MISPGRRRVFAALLITISVCSSWDAWAQTRSALTGTIRNGAGAALAGVTVTLESPSVPGGAQTTLTNARGVYRFPELPPGVYELTATQQGLQMVERTELRVPVGTTLTVDLTLHATGVPEAVTISGAGPVVDVTTAASTTKLTTEDLENLPFGGAAALLQLVPGVTPGAGPVPSSIFGSGADTSQSTAEAPSNGRCPESISCTAGASCHGPVVSADLRISWSAETTMSFAA